MSVVTAKEYHFVSDGIVCHLGGSAGWRRSIRRNQGPANAVECPCVVQITCAIESTEHDHFAAGRIVSHRKIRARWRRSGGRKLNPISCVRLGHDCSRSERDCTAAAVKNHKPTRKVPHPIEFHRRELRRSTRTLSNCGESVLAATSFFIYLRNLRNLWMQPHPKSVPAAVSLA